MLIPNPVLDQINWKPNSLSYFSDTWVHAASAWLDGDYNKWNLTRGVNRIYLCYGTTTPNSCDVRLNAAPAHPSTVPLTSCRPDPTNHARRWWARIVSATGRIQFTCVTRMDHKKELDDWVADHPGQAYLIPGAARWRWLYSDDGTWIGCPTGCCTKH
jgi:hypothetical protein